MKQGQRVERIMKIKTMWGLRVGGTSPELMTAWDELCVEEHPGGFAEDCALRRRAWGSDLKAERLIDIEVDMRAINDYFSPKTVEGKVAKPTGLEEAALHGASSIVVPPSLRKTKVRLGCNEENEEGDE